jgi:hypothetical protein
MLPDSAGLFVLSLTAFSMAGAAVGVVVTAASSLVRTPTGRSFGLNVGLGAVGFDVGILVCAANNRPDFWSCAIPLASLLTIGNEVVQLAARRGRRIR